MSEHPWVEIRDELYLGRRVKAIRRENIFLWGVAVLLFFVISVFLISWLIKFWA